MSGAMMNQLVIVRWVLHSTGKQGATATCMNKCRERSSRRMPNMLFAQSSETNKTKQYVVYRERQR